MADSKYPIWFLNTYGGGTPEYLIIAPDRETAWELAKEKWREKYRGPIGCSTYSYCDGNTINDIKETGMYADLKNSITNIIDLHKI